MLDKEEYKLHREKIMANVPNKSAMILFARRPSEFKALPDKNFYYATGIKENDDIVFIVKNNDNIERRWSPDTFVSGLFLYLWMGDEGLWNWSQQS